MILINTNILSSQVVWFTALFPYVVLIFLLTRGITLPGSAEGVRYYLYPNFSMIAKPEVTLFTRIYLNVYLYASLYASIIDSLNY